MDICYLTYNEYTAFTRLNGLDALLIIDSGAKTYSHTSNRVYT